MATKVTPKEPHVTIDQEALARITATHHAVVDPDICAGAAIDWTGHWSGHTPAVFRPRNTTEMSALLADATIGAVPLQIQGGNTSLTGGATPYGEAVVSTTALTQLDVDIEAGRATVGAGVTAGRLAATLVGTGWELGVDLASRDSATIDGMISTNTGGLRVLRWGQMANQVLGAQAVLGDGTVLDHIDPPDRDNTGPRWHHLVGGAEGTLGVLTAATIRLVPAERACTTMVAFASINDAVAAALATRRSIAGLRPVRTCGQFLGDACPFCHRGGPGAVGATPEPTTTKTRTTKHEDHPHVYERNSPEQAPSR